MALKCIETVKTKVFYNIPTVYFFYVIITLFVSKRVIPEFT